MNIKCHKGWTEFDLNRAYHYNKLICPKCGGKDYVGGGNELFFICTRCNPTVEMQIEDEGKPVFASAL